MRVSNKIVLASTNKDKYLEFVALFQSYPELTIVPAQELIRNADKIGLVETFHTYRENSVAKARLANQGSHFPSIADDSGLEVEALEGKPGPRSARYAIPKAGVGQDEANVQKLLEELKGTPAQNRNAKFVACLSVVMEGIELHATGTLEGTIAESPSGNNGFGYDPIFIPKGENRTLAQMSDAEKNSMSHRARALKELMEKIREKGIHFAKP